MAYASSLAKEAALARIENIRATYSYAREKALDLPANIRNAIFQCCVFQLSAAFEDYIWGLIVSWFARLASGGALNSAIPLFTRGVSIAKTHEHIYRRYIVSGDEVKLVAEITENGGIYKLLDENVTFEDADLAKKIAKSYKFPTAENIDRLFKRLGFDAIFNLLRASTKTDVQLALRAFIDVRNAIAHESPPSITDVDVARYIAQVENWINALDQIFYSHVADNSGDQFWARVESGA